MKGRKYGKQVFANKPIKCQGRDLSSMYTWQQTRWRVKQL